MSKTVSVKVHWTPENQAVNDLDLYHVRISIDETDQDRVWISMVDAEGNEVEGGSFSKSDFMSHVLDFYNRNY